MLRELVSSVLSPGQKRRVRARVSTAKVWLARRFRGYGRQELVASLRRMGIASGSTLMVHANFPPDSGFEGSPGALLDALIETVGEDGNLMMVSIPFRGFAYDYLAADKVFDVRKTISMMGLVSEVLRRRPGVARSLHPTHPVLAYGKERLDLIRGHERCLYPTGEGTPFERLCEADGRVLLLDVGFGALTLFHYVEHLVRDRLPFGLYDERRFHARVRDQAGHDREVVTLAFARNVRRRQDLLYEEMGRRGQLVERRIGNSRAIVARARDVVETMTSMVEAGVPLLEQRQGPEG